MLALALLGLVLCCSWGSLQVSAGIRGQEQPLGLGFVGVESRAAPWRGSPRGVPGADGVLGPEERPANSQAWPGSPPRARGSLHGSSGQPSGLGQCIQVFSPNVKYTHAHL